MKFLHRYIGLVVCGFLFCISLSGTLLLLKHEYLWLSIPSARVAIDHNQLASAVDSMERQYSDRSLFVQIYSQDLSLHKAFLPDRHYAYHQQNGDIIKAWQENGTVEDWLLDFHHRFLLGNTVGLNLAGGAGLLVIPLIIIGVVMWWPYRRFWKAKLRFSSKHAYARSSHSNLGVVVALPLVLVAITGVILVYPNESRWLLTNGFSTNAPVPKLIEKTVNADSLQAQIDYVLTEFPGAKLRWIQAATDGQHERVIGLSQQGAWDNSGKTSIRFMDQKVLIKNARQQSNKVRALDLSYVLHIGNIHFLYRLFLILAGVLTCGLTFFAGRSFFLRTTSK